MATPFPFAPVGRCIYCGRADGLSDEHPTPEALGGILVLPKASCPTCAVITGKFEQKFARHMYWALRLRLGIKGKRSRRKQRRTHWSVTVDGTETIEIEVGKIPEFYVVPEFPPAGIILGEPPRDTNPEFKLNLVGDMAALEQLMKEAGAGKFETNHFFDWNAFNRQLAKIAHALAVATYGFDGLEYLLVPIILGDDGHFPYFIGGVGSPAEALPSDKDAQFVYRDIFGDLYLTIKISFFWGRSPTYEVVCARITDRALVFSKTR
jgi:hypothetical protein